MLCFKTLRRVPHNWTVVFISALWLVGCVGSPVASYKTETQKFNWGKMYVWMSKAVGTRSGDTEGSGYLLVNLTLKKKVMGKGCTLTLKRVYLRDPDRGVVLIDGIASFSDARPMTTEIGEYNSRQLSLSQFPFEYEQSNFPYDLSLDLDFNCRGKQTSHEFSKQIGFSMVQPVLWEQ